MFLTFLVIQEKEAQGIVTNKIFTNSKQTPSINWKKGGSYQDNSLRILHGVQIQLKPLDVMQSVKRNARMLIEWKYQFHFSLLQIQKESKHKLQTYCRIH